MDDNGNQREDLRMPSGTDDAEKLAKNLQADFDAGKDLIVTVLKVQFSMHLEPALLFIVYEANVVLSTCDL